MKYYNFLIALLISVFVYGQGQDYKLKIETTLNNYIDGFYQGDTLKLKAALKPRLYKFGYLKDKETGTYNYYQHLSYKNALKLAQNIKDKGRIRTETKMRSVKVLEISNHIAAAKVTAAWGLDYVLLSKDNGKWMIEEVIWEGPFEDNYIKPTKTTTYCLIRHAEKDKAKTPKEDIHLNAIGKKRAQNWAKVFEDVKFDAIYTTNYNRTIETILPTAEAKNLDIIKYNPNTIDIHTFKENTKGKTILIVGHSNTIPAFANLLLGTERYKKIDESNNANLYIINDTDNVKTSTLLKIN